MSRQGIRQATPRGVAAVIALVVLAFGAGFYIGDRAARPDPRSMEGVVAAIGAQQEEDQRRMSEELVSAAGQAHAELMVVLAAMNRAMPVEAGAYPVPASPQEVEGWRRGTASALEAFAGFGTGTTEFNTTLAALRGAVQQIDAAAALYAVAPSGDAQTLLELAGARRNEAVDLWAAGAEQLDSLAMGAGLGHMHLFLPVTGDLEQVPLEFQEPVGDF